MIKYYIIVFVITIMFFQVNASNISNLDSLKQIVATSNNDSNIVNALNNLSSYYIDANQDSAYVFVNKGQELVTQNANIQQQNNFSKTTQRYALAASFLFIILIASIYIILKFKKNKQKTNETKTRYLESLRQNIEISTKSEKQKKIITESVKEFEDTINNFEDVYFRTNKKFIYKQVSSSINKHLEIENISQIIGKPLTTFWDVSKTDVKLITLKILRENYINDFLFDYKTSKGEIKHAKINARAVYKNNVFVGIEGIIRDVTNDIKLKKLKEKYERILDSVNDSIFITDKTGKLIYANKTTYESTEYTHKEILEKNIANFIPKSEISKYLRKTKHVFEDEKLAPFETIIIDKNGIYIPIEVSGKVVEYEGNSVILGSFRDITERRIAEQIIKEKTEKYELLTNAIDDFIWMIDIKMQNLYISPSCKKLTGYTKEEIEIIGIIHLHTSESLIILNKTIAKALASSDKELNISVELDYIHKNGSIIHTQVIGHVIYKDNKAIAFGAVSRIIN